MFLERRNVSRKTPLDGKLEISPSTASELASRNGLIVRMGGTATAAQVEEMICTCGKGGGERHPHHFLVSPLFVELQAGNEVQLSLEETTGEVLVQPVVA